MKASIHTLGCKVNRAESEYIAQTLKENGFEIASCESGADIFIINSCTVTSTADKKNEADGKAFQAALPEQHGCAYRLLSAGVSRKGLRA